MSIVYPCIVKCFVFFFQSQNIEFDWWCLKNISNFNMAVLISNFCFWNTILQVFGFSHLSLGMYEAKKNIQILYQRLELRSSIPHQISEKQRTLYEALERQQKYQDTLQSISSKMETTEFKLNESLEPSKSPESQMAEHQVKTFYIRSKGRPCITSVSLVPFVVR